MNQNTANESQQSAPQPADKSDAGDITHFGFKTVKREEKQGLVNDVFTSVAESYDVMNDLMSMGVHRLWKRHFAHISGAKAGDRVLDLAGGTGDIARLLMPKVAPDGHVVIGDINAEMLAVGQRRLIDEGFFGQFSIRQLNAEELPFDDDAFDLITIAFGLRNVPDQQKALNEMHRCLKPGGRVMVLEFSRVTSPALQKVYDFYSFKLLPEMGQMVARDRESYQYLVESIRKHPDQNTLKGMLESAGFELCSVNNLTGGIVAIHSGYKT
jgi:demethylmenaquinone methyltransferase/2-methoxy-6-polyprenyl-1,4-benzoquinol methylase